MASEWFYSLNGEKHGPFSSQQLRRLAQSGKLPQTALLWKKGMKEWRPASEAQKLFEGASVPDVTSGAEANGSAPDPQAANPTKASKASVTLGQRVRNAARLTALKAEQTKLSTVSLPAAYVALGKHLYAARLFAERFPELYQQLDDLKAQAAEASKKAADATGTTFTEKAKALAQKGAELAKSKATEVQQLAVFKRLGEAASEGTTSESIDADRLKDIVAIRGRVTAISDMLSADADSSPNTNASTVTNGVEPSPWKGRLKWIGGTLAALWLIGFVMGPRQDGASQGDTSSSGASETLSEADRDNPDFAEGYQAGLESRSMSPQDRGQFLMGLEQQIPSKADPKAFRRGMAKAFREGGGATSARDAGQSNGATTNTQAAAPNVNQSKPSTPDADQVEQDDTTYTVTHEGKTEVRTWRYANGKPMKEIRFKNGKEDGLARAWYDNGKPAWERTYRVAVQEGPHKVWWANGKMKIQETMRAGKSEGPYKEWDENGVLIKDGAKKNDKWTKMLHIYWPNGKRSLECEFEDGERQGRLKEWDKQGNLSEVSYWKDGILNGRRQKWTASGKVLSDRNYTGGKADRSKVMSALIRSHEADGYTVTQVSEADLPLAGKILDHAVAGKRQGQDHRVLCFLEAEAFDSSGASYFTLVELMSVVHEILVIAAWKGPVAEHVIRGNDATYAGIIVIGQNQALLSLGAPRKNQPSTDFSQMRVGKEVFSVGGEVRSLPFSADQQKEITDFLTAGTGG